MESSSAAVACAFASFSGPQRAMSAAPTKVTSWVCAMTWLLKQQTWSTGTQNNTMTSPLVNNIVTSEGSRWSEHFLNMLSYPVNLILEVVLSPNHYCPEPVRLTACGLPLALSAMLIEAARDPIAEGVKVTLMLQLPPAATEAPHVLLWAKSATFEPVIEMLVILRVVLALLVRFTV